MNQSHPPHESTVKRLAFKVWDGRTGSKPDFRSFPHATDEGSPEYSRIWDFLTEALSLGGTLVDDTTFVAPYTTSGRNARPMSRKATCGVRSTGGLVSYEGTDAGSSARWSQAIKPSQLAKGIPRMPSVTHSREKPSHQQRVQESMMSLCFRCQAGPNYSPPSSMRGDRSILRTCALRQSLQM